ncbi:MAG: sigma-70 family RNA polymerase sigma factor [Planctomycetes bacterium]|nr:sigma-70 family RNA polymerase sigma factor [Planctomycetota bacterium]
METNPTHPRIDDLLAHAGFVRRLAQGLVSGDAADDVVQETWLAAIKSPPRQPASIRVWLERVTRGVAFRFHRGETRRFRREAASARGHELPSTADLVAQQSVLHAVVDAVFALEEPYRSTILLRFYEDLSAAEIARRLGVPAATVRSRLQRGLQQIRTRLDRAQGGRREGWCGVMLAFVGRPDSARAATKAVVKGAFVMSVKAKSAIGIVLLLVVVFAAWWLVLVRGRELSRDVAGAPRDGRAPIDRVTRSSTVPSRLQSDSAGSQASDALASIPVSVPEAEPKGSLLIRLTWEEDDTPAAGVCAKIVTWGSDLPHALAIETKAGDDGQIFVEHVAAGKVGIYVDRGGGATVTVKPSELTTCDVVIPAGFTLQGQVVDRAGNPVSHADVWFSDYFNYGEGLVPAESDENGAFRLRSVESSHYVGARKAGYAPSPIQLVRGTRGEVISVRLVLPGPGGSLQGLVRDAAGEPVASAIVQITGLESRGAVLDTGETASAPAPSLWRTNSEGRFTAAGLPLGPATICARSSGFAPWEGRAVVDEGKVEELDIVLGVGATLAGTVRDSKGDPVPEAFVGAGDYGGFLSSQTETDQAGAYRLHGLAAGDLHARASAESRGRVDATITVKAGETAHWDAVLDLGLKIVGRIVDEADHPLEGWIVEATPSMNDSGCHRQAFTDAEGRFVLVNCKDDVYRVEVREPENYASHPIATVTGARPSATELSIRVSNEMRPSAFVIGRLEDASGAAVGGAKILLWPENGRFTPNYFTDPKTGEFRIGPVPPGRYRGVAEAKGLGQLELGTCELIAGQTLDLGVSKFARPGNLVVTCALDPGLRKEAVRLSVSEAGKNSRGMEGAVSDFPDSVPLSPGHYCLRASGDRVVESETAFDILEGEETRLTVEVRQVVIRLRFVVPEAVSVEQVQVRILGEDSSVDEATVRRASDGSLEYASSTFPGICHVVATAGALRGEMRFNSRGSMRTPERLIEIPLR